LGIWQCWRDVLLVVVVLQWCVLLKLLPLCHAFAAAAAAAAAAAPQTLLRKDFEMLSSFKQDSACRVICDGNTFEPR
jgi:hypothetical protein